MTLITRACFWSCAQQRLIYMAVREILLILESNDIISCAQNPLMALILFTVKPQIPTMPSQILHNLTSCYCSDIFSSFLCSVWPSHIVLQAVSQTCEAGRPSPQQQDILPANTCRTNLFTSLYLYATFPFSEDLSMAIPPSGISSITSTICFFISSTYRYFNMLSILFLLLPISLMS